MANRLLTINVRKYLSKQPRRKRHMKLPKYIRYKVAQATNVRSSNIKISKELNSIMLKRYLHSMERMKVNISIDKEIATVTHFESRAKPEAAAKQQSGKSDEGKEVEAKTKGSAKSLQSAAKQEEKAKTDTEVMDRPESKGNGKK